MATAKRRGRPPKQGERLEEVSLSLPPSMIEQMKGEQNAQGVESLSAIARLAIGGYLRRVGKRRERVE